MGELAVADEDYERHVQVRVEMHAVTGTETAPIKLAAHERIVSAELRDGQMFVYIERIH